MNYRPMTADDFPVVAYLGRLMHRQSVFSHMRFAEEDLFLTLAKAISSEDYFAKVAEYNGEVVGAMLAFRNKSFFGPDYISNDLAVFTPFNNRGIGQELISLYVSWAKARGVKRICLGVHAGIDNRKAVKVLKKMGFQEQGHQMVLGV